MSGNRLSVAGGAGTITRVGEWHGSSLPTAAQLWEPQAALSLLPNYHLLKLALDSGSDLIFLTSSTGQPQVIPALTILLPL